ncbi:MAG: tetratricopeptide repeat protein [Acidobacteria bacterium]|nr:MAG: tetratricopeptide repeat protein [Acidobacteriota bacterium]
MVENETGKSPLEAFEELAAKAPDNVMVHYSLGREYLKAKRYAEAERELREALRLKPDYSAAYRELGKSLVGLDRPDEAREVYTKGVEVACGKGDLQTQREIEVFLRRLDKAGA